MMDKKSRQLNIGVIGAGWWATSAHIPGILGHESARLIAVQNRTMDKARRISSDFGAQFFFEDHRELINLEDLDGVVISSTPNVHYEQAKYALSKGKHVLIEKPMTFTASQARDLCDMASKNRVHLLVSCPWHYTRHSIESTRMISEGMLGDIKMISVLMTNPVHKLLKGTDTAPTHGLNETYIEPNPGSYSNPEIAGGGQIYAQVSHVGAYLSFLTSANPVEVYAKFDNAGSKTDIYNTLNVTMDNGALVSIASTGATPLNIRQYEVRVFGTKGILLLELWQGQMSFHSFGGEDHHFEKLADNEIYPDQAPVKNFIDAILGHQINGSPGELGLAAMEIIEAACLSDREQRLVKISEL